MAPRRSGGKDLRRRAASRPERKTVLIFCEGEASEPDYLNALKRMPEIRNSTAVNLVIDPSSGVPLDLVKKAALRKRSDAEIDECWCVFDVEWPKHHPNLDRALRIASAEGIGIAVSKPVLRAVADSAFPGSLRLPRQPQGRDHQPPTRRAPRQTVGRRQVHAAEARCLRPRGQPHRPSRARRDRVSEQQSLLNDARAPRGDRGDRIAIFRLSCSMCG